MLTGGSVGVRAARVARARACWAAARAAPWGTGWPRVTRGAAGWDGTGRATEGGAVGCESLGGNRCVRLFLSAGGVLVVSLLFFFLFRWRAPRHTHTRCAGGGARDGPLSPTPPLQLSAVMSAVLAATSAATAASAPSTARSSALASTLRRRSSSRPRMASWRGRRVARMAMRAVSPARAAVWTNGRGGRWGGGGSVRGEGRVRRGQQRPPPARWARHPPRQQPAGAMGSRHSRPAAVADKACQSLGHPQPR